MASKKKSDVPPPAAPGDPTDPAPPPDEVLEGDETADIDEPPKTPRDGPPMPTMARVRQGDSDQRLGRRPTPYERTQAAIAARDRKPGEKTGGGAGSAA